jgi:hypothetical protein
MRARIDISELEAQTKIRAKYLRALENEEWSLLPGPTFVKSFLRTYAEALGLDAKRILDEYKLENEIPGELELQPIAPTRVSTRDTRRRQRGGGGGGRRVPGLLPIAGVIVVALIVVLGILGAIGGGGSKKPHQTVSTPVRTTPLPKLSSSAALPSTVVHRSDRVALQILPTAPVYVCLATTTGRVLLNGVTLSPGTAPQTYRAHEFLLVLGNDAATLKVDGHTRNVSSGGASIGYSISRAGRHVLPASRWPKCT